MNVGTGSRRGSGPVTRNVLRRAVASESGLFTRLLPDGHLDLVNWRRGVSPRGDQTKEMAQWGEHEQFDRSVLLLSRVPWCWAQRVHGLRVVA